MINSPVKVNGVKQIAHSKKRKTENYSRHMGSTLGSSAPASPSVPTNTVGVFMGRKPVRDDVLVPAPGTPILLLEFIVLYRIIYTL